MEILYNFKKTLSTLKLYLLFAPEIQPDIIFISSLNEDIACKSDYKVKARNMNPLVLNNSITLQQFPFPRMYKSN